ncbi:MAG: hypothetical protein ACRDZ5_08110, partial [Acidimicrobiales bacterium]
MSFEDAGENRTWLIDVTFLESHWSCIFAGGCQGVLTQRAPELVQGCCSYGAHFTDGEDVARVEAAAATLTAGQWQFRSLGRRRGTVRTTRAGESVTRLVAGACIFLNRPEHPGGAGCALHRAALERSISPMELKPDVCWQLPLRREDSVAPDGHVTSTVTQWQRRNWGAGGSEFAWWCTEEPDAFRAPEPVYRTMRGELTAMVGPEVYEAVAAYLETRSARPLEATPVQMKPSQMKPSQMKPSQMKPSQMKR